jgi:response regulator RpfG family c-di-GMP phosphodiesterase
LGRAAVLNSNPLWPDRKLRAMRYAKTTILCLDDHWKSLIGRKMLLEKNGYRVLEATNGSDALRLFLSQPVDAVVLDYQTRGVNAEKLAADMKLLKPGVPIVMLSAFGPLPENKLKAVDSFVLKSQSPKAFVAAVHTVVDGWSKPFFYRWLDHWKGRNQGIRL